MLPLIILTGPTTSGKSETALALARHELSLNMNSLLDQSAPLLKKGGQISLAYPPERMSEVLRELECRSLYPNLARFVHGNFQTAAKIFLVSALKGKNSDFSIAPPLAVYNNDETYSKETKEIYASFNYTDRPNDFRQK